MANSFNLSDEQKRVLSEILKHDGADFSVLVDVAGLDPSVDFRGADIRGIDFGHSDLGGYDFSYADISGCRFDRARLKGAIFANNLDKGTVWPRPDLERRSHRAVLRTTTDFELRPFLREAVSNIVAALERDVTRPIVLMPPGTGRTRLIEALLSELDSREMVRVALVYTPTQAVAEQLRHFFCDSFGTEAVSGSLQVTSSARVIVASLPGRDPGLTRKSIRIFDEVSHIFILDGTLHPRVLREIQSSYPGVQIVIFGDPGLLGTAHRVTLSEEGEIVFALSYDQATSIGLLERAEIHSSGRHIVENAAREDMEQIVSEVFEVVSSMPNGATGGVVCRSVSSVRELARELHDSIDNHRQGHEGIRRIVQHTSPSADKSLVQAALDLPGTLLLMTDSIAMNFEWADIDFAIVLTRLRSPERLAFIPTRRDHRKRLQVIDYMRNFRSR